MLNSETLSDNPMKLYARVFIKILDSSLAEDWQARHVFEDFLKLASMDGIVDMTHSAIARRTNIPLEIVRAAIEKLEAPDPMSRGADEDGRRLARLDAHRDWGWRIVNFDKYEAIRQQQDVREAERVKKATSRANAKAASEISPCTPSKRKDKDIDIDIGGPGQSGTPRDMSGTCPGQNEFALAISDNKRPKTHPKPQSVIPPELESVRAFMVANKKPAHFADEFWDFYGSKGWMVGKNPMKDWHCAARRWRGSGLVASPHQGNPLARRPLSSIRSDFAGISRWPTSNEDRERKLNELRAEAKAEHGVDL